MTGDRLTASLNSLSQVRKGEELRAFIEKVAPGRLAADVDKASPLYQAFQSMADIDRFAVFEAAFSTAQMGNVLFDLVATGSLKADDLDHLRSGARAIRTIDYHVPGRGDDCNDWFELRMRYVQIQIAQAEWHNSTADFEERTNPCADRKERNRARAQGRAEKIDNLIAEINADLELARKATA